MIKEACKNSGIGKSTFYDRRFIVELMKADHDTFISLYQEEKRVGRLNKLCREKLAESPLKRLHEGMKKDGMLLP